MASAAVVVVKARWAWRDLGQQMAHWPGFVLYHDRRRTLGHDGRQHAKLILNWFNVYRRHAQNESLRNQVESSRLRELRWIEVMHT